MQILRVKCDVSQVSDGYHTFEELYNHRHVLFLALMKSYPGLAWASPLHHDETEFTGFFIAGINLPQGMVTYHLPLELWGAAVMTCCEVLPTAPPFDGHSSTDVIDRLKKFAISPIR